MRQYARRSKHYESGRNPSRIGISRPLSAHSVHCRHFRHRSLKGGIIPFIFCAAIDFCFRFKLDSAKTLWAFLKKYAQYILLLTIVSLVVYVSDTSDTALIARGMQKVFYQILTVLGAVCAVYEFREKAPTGERVHDSGCR